MRLWHKDLIQYLPDSQLKSQWRELNLIFKNQPKHILINYVYEYPKKDLLNYTRAVVVEMNVRKIKIKSFKNLYEYFKDDIEGLKDFETDNYASLIPNCLLASPSNAFKNHHNERYMRQCFYNLQEKYDRGQKDFTKEVYDKLARKWDTYFTSQYLTKEEMEE